MAEEYEGGEDENLEQPPSFFPYSGNAASRESATNGELVEVNVQGVFGAENNGRISHFVLLTDGVRKLPIVIGTAESSSILTVLEQKRPERPNTHDLIRKLLDRLDSEVVRAVIDDSLNSVYYAKLYVTAGGEEIEIDCRPSDAIAIALRFDAQIFVADQLLDIDSDLV
jgi:bifunctional DNase/RNase